MPIEIAAHAGFCMGVRRAVESAVQVADSGVPSYHSQHHHYCENYHRPDGTCSCGNQGGRKRCSGSGGSAATATHAPADSCSQGNDGSPKGNHRTADQGSCHDYQGDCFT